MKFTRLLRPAALLASALLSSALNFSCSWFSGPRLPQILGFEKGAAFESTILVECFHSILGFDPVDLSCVTRIKTSTYVASTRSLGGGKILFADDGRRVGIS